MEKDFYAILGVNKTASEQEIKQAYRKLSKELHPDKHKGDKEKEEKFKRVNEAYETLSDPKKRQTYDQFGAQGNPFGGGGGAGFNGFQGFEGFDPSQFGGFGDIFETFFGGNGQRRGRAKTGEQHGSDIRVRIRIPLSTAVTGEDRPIAFATFVACKDCHGSGNAEGSSMVTCGECSGNGFVMKLANSLFGRIQQNVLCPQCHGAGRVPKTPCKHCSGKGRVEGKKTITVHIPAGIEDGQSLKVRGEGEAGQNGTPAGDLYVEIVVEKDQRFERQDADIYSAVQVPLLSAVLGGTMEIPTVHGTTELVIPAGLQPKQVLRVKGKGMPIVNSSRMGDHFVTMEIEIPTKLSKEQKRLFEELQKLQ